MPCLPVVRFVQKLQQEAAKALRLPDVREKLLAQGAEPIGSTPEEFNRFLDNEIARWAKVIKASKMQLN